MYSSKCKFFNLAIIKLDVKLSLFYQTFPKVTSFTLNLTYARPVTHTLIGSIKEFFALKVKVKVANLQLLLEAVKRYVLERPIPVVIVVLI